MSLVQPDVSRAAAVDEMLGVAAWVSRHSAWKVTLGRDELRLLAEVDHPRQGQGRLYLVAELDDYRVLPPAWRFVDGSGDSPRGAWPAPAPITLGQASIFHTQPVLCAPFNRLAYKQEGGPHGNWGPPTNWLADRPGYVRATHLGEMLAAINMHLSVSPGRMS